MCIKIKPEFQWLEGQDKNSNVWKDKVGIPVFIKIGLEFHSLEELYDNSNAYRSRARIPMFWRNRPENQCFQGKKDKIRIKMLTKKGAEFQCV